MTPSVHRAATASGPLFCRKWVAKNWRKRVRSAGGMPKTMPPGRRFCEILTRPRPFPGIHCNLRCAECVRSHMQFALLLGLAALQGPSSKPQPEAAPPTSVAATRAVVPPIIDGKDDDAVWKQA